MLCRLCCEVCLDFEDLYDKDDQENYIYKICQKFFSREMEKLVMTVGRCTKIICDNCWKTINEFNDFYEKIIAQQTEYINSIDASTPLALTGHSDSFILKNIEGVNADIIVHIEDLRKSPAETKISKDCDLENVSLNTDLSMIAVDEQTDSARTSLKSSVKIKVEEDLIDVDKNEVGKDNDTSQSLSSSSLTENLTEDSCNKSKDQDKESHKLKFNEFQKNRIQENDAVMLEGKRKIIKSEFILNNEIVRVSPIESPKTCDKGSYMHSTQTFMVKSKVPNDSTLSDTEMSDFNDSVEIKIEKEFMYDSEENKLSEGCASQSFSKSLLIQHYADDSDDEEEFGLSCPEKFQGEASESQKKGVHKIVYDMLSGKWKLCFCCDCEFATYDYSKFINHFEQVHPENIYSQIFQSPSQCEMCHKWFTQRSGLRRHLKNHNDDKNNYECPECQESFGTLKILNSHIKEKHPKIILRYICDVCGAQLATRWSGNAHKKSKFCISKGQKEQSESSSDSFSVVEANKIIFDFTAGKWKPTFRCDLCELFFKKYAHFVHHYKEFHPNNLNSEKFKRPFECDICHKSYQYKTGLKGHLNAHKRDFTRNVCPVCDKRFVSQRNRDKHMKIVHSE